MSDRQLPCFRDVCDSIFILVLKVGMDYLASKYFGLGTQLNVNLNTELPMIQVALCFSFGKLK
ncbi:MAG: hypothetical protein JXA72_02870 [Bacteroidales bacterium]|nr:hypothetical protein [Bacteroidales bacterium]